MSNWINEFAGKAENLLNTIDRNASRILDNEEGSVEKEGFHHDSYRNISDDGNRSYQEERKEEDNHEGSLEEECDEECAVIENEMMRDREIAEKLEDQIKRKYRDQEIRLKKLLTESQFQYHQLQRENEDQLRNHEEYKVKAQKTLVEKERIISELKGAKRRTTECGEETTHRESNSFERDEIKHITFERDFIREEANRVANCLKVAQSEVKELEERVRQERILFEEASVQHERQLDEEKKKREEIEKELEKKREDIITIEDAYSHQQTSYLKSIETRDAEIERMRRQLSGLESDSLKDSSTMMANTEKRIKDLAIALVQKQALITNLQSEKASLVHQLEKMKMESNMLKTSNMNGLVHRYSSSNQSDEAHHVYVESPFDSGVTRKVKRAYSSLDSFSIWIGIFFRKYPIVRIGVMVYGVMLHLWVFTILFHSVPDLKK